jgi:hypothetical protein
VASFEAPEPAASLEPPTSAASFEEPVAAASEDAPGEGGVGDAVEAGPANGGGELQGHGAAGTAIATAPAEPGTEDETGRDGERTAASDGPAGAGERPTSDDEALPVMPAELPGEGHGRERKPARAGRPERERELSARFLAVTAEREDGTVTSEFDLYEDIYFRIRYRVLKPLHLFQVVLVIRAGFEHIVQTYDTDDESVIVDHPVGVFERRVKVDRFFLKEGRYAITLQCGTQTELIDSHVDALRFDITCRQEDPNMEYRSYRRDRPGKVIFHGAWLGDREPLP